jgi:lipoprotein-anchoring transpeptidase ErfK/SrfK
MDSKKLVIIVVSSSIVILAVVFGIGAILTRGPSGSRTPSAAQDPYTKDDAKMLEGGPILASQDDLLKARAAYQKALEKAQGSGDAETAEKAQGELDNLNIQILFSGVMTPDSETYIVQKGDNLTKIAKKFNTTTELITRSNNLRGSVLRVGQRLKISKALFSIVVDKSQNILTLKSNGEIFKTYSVSTGKNMTTPIGTFKIINKIVNPPWFPLGKKMVPAGDPNNVLGSRWLGISSPSYGIHGTTDPESIGKNVTEGCIRMRNQDVEELYAIVPEGTEVVIVD